MRARIISGHPLRNGEECEVEERSPLWHAFREAKTRPGGRIYMAGITYELLG